MKTQKKTSTHIRGKKKSLLRKKHLIGGTIYANDYMLNVFSSNTNIDNYIIFENFN